MEEMLYEKKKTLDASHAPKELESRLRNTLNQVPEKGKRTKPSWLIATAILFVFVIGYHYDGFAYYGKKLLGFDELINNTLKDLNNQGMGQAIDKTVILRDGTVFTIDGIMSDENQMILYYTIANSNGLTDQSNELLSFSEVTGFLTRSHQESGTSILNTEKTELKGVMTYEPVSAFSKELTLHYRIPIANNQMKEATISFPYDPNQAMATEIKQSISKTVKVDQGKIEFQSITATPTSTVIKGKLNVNNFDRLPLGLSGIELIANGSSIPLLGSGNKTDIKGHQFEIEYDVLPKDLETLTLIVKDFVGYQELDKKISLSQASDVATPLPSSNHLWIRKVANTNNRIEVTIATENDILLDGVSIKTGNKEVPLTTTIGQSEKNGEGQTLKERTLVFEDKKAPDYLIIKGMHYIKEYNQTIEITID
jgi:hypothetical protein